MTQAGVGSPNGGTLNLAMLLNFQHSTNGRIPATFAEGQGVGTTMTIRVGLTAIVAATAVLAVDADARRGAELFEAQLCKTCHNGTTAPDLTRALGRDYTPAGITARMWNHAPAMWSAMNKAGMPTPNVSQQNAADLFAFFYSARYFDRPGDAGRGKRAFSAKHCADCHAVGSAPAGIGPAVAKWRAVADPVALVDHMWNHVPQMKSEFAKRGLKWPELTAQDLSDILVYVRNLPESRNAKPDFLLPPSESGEELFKTKGCSDCHTGARALALNNRTLNDIAASLWNHAPKMRQPATQISYEEMRQILGHLWAKQFFVAAGDANRGKRVFEAKRCASCHNNLPAISDLPSMVAALWKHGPQMLAKMESQGINWPLLTATEVSHVVAYLSKK